MSLVETHKQERRARILAAARKLLEQEGYEGVTMRALAEASGVSIPTLYNLFGGREPLLMAAVEERFRALLAPRDAGTEACDIGAVLALFATMNEQLIEAPRYARTTIQVFVAAQDSREIGVRMARALGERVAMLLAALKTRRVLLAWVDPIALSHRLCSHYLAAVIGWVANKQSPQTLRAITEYELCLALAPLVQKPSERGRLLSRVEALQEAVRAAALG